VRPADLLTAPSNEAGIPDVVNGILGAPDLVSPTYWAAELTKAVLGVDPVAHVAEFLTGDWQGVARAASALRNLAAFDDAVVAAVADQVGTMRASWHGNASDAASSYFDGLATAVSDGTPALEKLAHALETVAAGIWNVAEVVKSGLQTIGDLAFTAAVSSAAGSALVETGIGAVAGYALAAFCIWRMTSTWGEVLDKLSEATVIAKALVGLLATTLTRLDAAGDFPLPAAPYDHPGVPR
jgi:hypothetical protein